ncbi:polymerase delta-interacting protein 3 [Bulinus truncatus]|nr:polymerase delta-interacting protein 3 [Bulinus truncatus]
MADLSLDEIIRKKRVNINIKSNPRFQGPNKSKTFSKKNFSTQRKFDARQKLGPKKILDARDKIIHNKKTGAGDARNKIVEKQVQKGTFDARSLLQRQGKKAKHSVAAQKTIPLSEGGLSGVNLTRTLSNPIAKGRSHIQITNTGLQITRPIPNAEVSFTGNSLLVTKRTKPFDSNLNAVPIIQIRNDKYRQPSQQPVHSVNYLSQSTLKPSIQDYHSSDYDYYEPSYQSHHSYRDYDDPLHNPASVALDVPKIQISNPRPINTSVLKTVPYAGDIVKIQRAPPGSATVSQTSKQPPVKTVLQQTKLTQPGVKRKQTAEEGSGRLNLGKGGGPGIELASNDLSLIKKTKMSAYSEMDVDEEDKPNIISPLQGFRVMVTNLFSSVTQDDIIELFGAVGPLKKAKLLKAGFAEVVYVNKQDAVSAVEKYHSRELDGQPMYVKMTTPLAATVKKPVGDIDPDITGEALRLYKKGTGIGSLPEAPIEIPTIHRALFKAGPPGPNKSVKFTVKI